jgi:hypothetical protein
MPEAEKKQKWTSSWLTEPFVTSPTKDLHNVLWERAVQESADFVEPFLPNVLLFQQKLHMFDYVVQRQLEVFNSGLCLEFGVAGGASINWLSQRMSSHKFVGFDSFVGLKEDWFGHHRGKGAFSQNSELPKVGKNVQLIPGWFDETLPLFVEKNKSDLDDLTLLHVDGDTYEAAVAVFDELSIFLKPGVFVLFDELLCYPNWKNGEYRALCEMQAKFDVKYEFCAFSSAGQALIKII